MSLGASVAEGLMLGLASSAHCIGVCGPALAPLVVAAREEGLSPLRVALVFQAGRALGYGLVLGVSASVGVALASAAWSRLLAGVAMIVLAGAVLAYAALRNAPGARPCRALERWRYPARAPWLFGLLVGLSPCPPLLLACAALAEQGATATAVALAGGFIAATTAPALAVALLGIERIARRLRDARRVAAVIAGIWFLAQGITVLRGG